MGLLYLFLLLSTPPQHDQLESVSSALYPQHLDCTQDTINGTELVDGQLGARSQRALEIMLRSFWILCKS